MTLRYIHRFSFKMSSDTASNDAENSVKEYDADLNELERSLNMTDLASPSVKPKLDIPSLKLSLSKLQKSQKSKYPNMPLSAPSRNYRPNAPRQPVVPLKSDRVLRRKRVLPTPRLDEMPLSLRLHSNPIILQLSLRRQKISNFNMFHTEPAIDNQHDKFLRAYAQRRRILRESDNPFPNMPKLDIKIPIFLAKQMKYEMVADGIRKDREHKQRVRNMTPHVDNRLPANIRKYQTMRRLRLKNAQKKARKLNEVRLQSPPPKKPQAPTRRAPANSRKSALQKRRENKHKKAEITTYHSIKYVPEKQARDERFQFNSPKTAKLTLEPVRSGLERRRTTLIQALPCHFQEWQQ